MSEDAQAEVTNANGAEKEEVVQSPEKTEKSAEFLAQIREQIEFYLGDINLPRDSFFQQEIKKDEGWIEIPVMLKCNRLSKLTKEPEDIAAAVEASTLIQLSEDRTKIRRNPEIPLPENSLEYWQGLKKQSVYIKGFRQDTSLDEIKEFVKNFGTVINVLMRRDKTGDRAFKGSVFVTFKTTEEAEAFVKNDVNKLKDMDLIKMMQNDYWTSKQKEMKERKAADRQAKMAMKRKDVEEQKESKHTPQFIKGLVLAVTGLPAEDVDIFKLKDFFNKYGTVGFCVYEKGDDKAEIRFNGEENGADAVWKAAVAAGEDGKVMFEGKELSGRVLEGEEEEAYWNEFTKRRQEKMYRLDARRSGDRKRRRGGRMCTSGRGPKVRKFADSDDEPAEKKPNTAAEAEPEPPAEVQTEAG